MWRTHLEKLLMVCMHFQVYTSLLQYCVPDVTECLSRQLSRNAIVPDMQKIGVCRETDVIYQSVLEK